MHIVETWIYLWVTVWNSEITHWKLTNNRHVLGRSAHSSCSVFHSASPSHPYFNLFNSFKDSLKAKISFEKSVSSSPCWVNTGAAAWLHHFQERYQQELSTLLMGVLLLITVAALKQFLYFMLKNISLHRECFCFGKWNPQKSACPIKCVLALLSRFLAILIL